MLSSFPSFASNDIDWSSPGIDLELQQGKSYQQNILIGNLPSVNKIKIRASKSIKDWISISPSVIKKPMPNKYYSVNIIVNIPDDELIGSYFGRLRVISVNPKEEISEPLDISLDITEGRLAVLPEQPGEENDETVQGVDSDGDGVRDDIQIYIARQFSESEAIAEAMIDLARVYQKILAQSDSESKSIENYKLYDLAWNCAYFALQGDTKPIRVLEAKVLSTRERTKAYIAFNNHLATADISTTTENDYSKLCTFDINSLLVDDDEI